MKNLSQLSTRFFPDESGLPQNTMTASGLLVKPSCFTLKKSVAIILPYSSVNNFLFPKGIFLHKHPYNIPIQIYAHRQPALHTGAQISNLSYRTIPVNRKRQGSDRHSPDPLQFRLSVSSGIPKLLLPVETGLFPIQLKMRRHPEAPRHPV